MANGWSLPLAKSPSRWSHARGQRHKIFASAGLAGVDLSEAAFVIMQQAIEGMDSDLRAGMADIKGSAGSSSFPRRHR